MTQTKIDGVYEIVKGLGSGLSGEVLLVRDGGKEKALKFLKKIQLNVSKEEALRNFKNEFAILKELNHPHIARIYDYSFDRTLRKYYFTTELIRGEDFFSATAAMTCEQIEVLAVQVLRALQYLHSCGVYHFDIKPQNVLVQMGEGTACAKIIDFGLAGFTTPRKKVGTPAYMAPEIFVGGDLDGRADLYSFGVLLYKCFTRENPFHDKQVQETLKRHQTLVVPAAAEKRPDLPKYWDALFAGLLEKSPARRYAQAALVIRDINLLSGKQYEIETLDTRLSYLPEQGQLIGREEALKVFEDCLGRLSAGVEAADQAAGKRAQLLIVAGEEGTGKTRLLKELKYHAQLAGFPVWSWDMYVERGTIDPPVVLMVDKDAGVDASELRLLVQRFEEQPLLLVATALPGRKPADVDTTITLENFTREQLACYLGRVTGLANPPDWLVSGLLSRTAGNPLFVTEMIKNLLHHGLLLDETGRWAQGSLEDFEINYEKLAVPQTLANCLEQVYERLEQDPREIIDVLAVLGRASYLDEITQLCRLVNPFATIIKLTEQGLLEKKSREQDYDFKNPMFRHVVYRHLNPERCGCLHDQVAERLSADKHHEILWHQVFGRDRVCALAAAFTLFAELKEKPEEEELIAIFAYLDGCARHYGQDDQVRIKVKLAEAHALHFDNTMVVKILSELVELMPGDRGDVREKITLFNTLGQAYLRLDDYQKAEHSFAAALRWLELLPHPDKAIELIIRNHRANVLYRQGQYDQAIEEYTRTLQEWSEVLNDVQRSQVVNNYLGDVYLWTDRLAEALDIFSRDLLFAVTHKILPYQARTHLNLGMTYRRKNELEKAIEELLACVELAKKIRSPTLLYRAYNELGNIFMTCLAPPDYAKSADYYQRSLMICQKRKDVRAAIGIARNLAVVTLGLGQPRQAVNYLIYAKQLVTTLQDPGPLDLENLFFSVLSLIENWCVLGDKEKASASYQEAVSLHDEHAFLKKYSYWILQEKARLAAVAGDMQAFAIHCQKIKECIVQGQAEQKYFDQLLSDLTKMNVLKENASAPLIVQPQAKGNVMQQTSEVSLTHQWEWVLKINRHINNERNLDALLKIVLGYVLELTGAHAGLVLLVHNGELEIRSALNAVLDKNLSTLSLSVARRALTTGEVVVSEDALSDQRFDSAESVVLNELRSILCLPIKSHNKVVGVFYLDNRYQVNAFKNVDMEILSAFCDQVGIAVENARLFEEIREAKKNLENKLAETSQQLKEAQEILREESGVFTTRYAYDHIVSKSKKMQEIFKVLDKITETTLSVFIYGESGTGKELIAKAIHYNNPARSEKRFVAVNCGALPPNIIESELFGHKAGSFTGAVKDKKGLFEEADGGTLFLDEIGELDPMLQVKLLRALQEGEIVRVGDTKPVTINVRVVCASHQDIEQMIKSSKFRQDLFYRLCQIRIDLPALRERKEDIPLLVKKFVDDFRDKNAIKQELIFTSEVMRSFMQYDWPGNIRELANTVEVAAALRDGNQIGVESLSPNYGVANLVAQQGETALRSQGPSIKLDDKNYFDPRKTWRDYEALIIAKAYQHNEFKKIPTAKMLGISHSTLYSKLEEYGLEDTSHPLFGDVFEYKAGMTVKDYLPLAFEAALACAEGHPYRAIKQLDISQGYFYKVIKLAKAS